MKCENCYGVLIIWMQWDLYTKKNKPERSNLFFGTAAGSDGNSWLREIWHFILLLVEVTLPVPIMCSFIFHEETDQKCSLNGIQMCSNKNLNEIEADELLNGKVSDPSKKEGFEPPVGTTYV